MTFNPGDKIRRLTSTPFQDGDGLQAGAIYTAREATEGIVFLEERDHVFSYNAREFELVEAATEPEETPSAMRQSVGFVVGYLTAIADPRVKRTEGLSDQDRAVLTRAVELLEATR